MNQMGMLNDPQMAMMQQLIQQQNAQQGQQQQNPMGMLSKLLPFLMKGQGQAGMPGQGLNTPGPTEQPMGLLYNNWLKNGVNLG